MGPNRRETTPGRSLDPHCLKHPEKLEKVHPARTATL
jgi:hypothetical protein